MENPNPESDEALATKAQHGDKNAFSELIRRYQNRLLEYASHIVRDYDKASDIVQDAFIKVYINLRSFNPKRQFSNWLFRIVHNEAINYIKKHKKEISLDDQEGLKQTIKSGSNVTAELEIKQLSEFMKDCLDQVPFRYREPLVLFFLEQKSYREIAEILKMPTATVGVRIKRGKSLLAVICKAKGAKHYV